MITCRRFITSRRKKQYFKTMLATRYTQTHTHTRDTQSKQQTLFIIALNSSSNFEMHLKNGDHVSPHSPRTSKFIISCLCCEYLREASLLL